MIRLKQGGALPKYRTYGNHRYEFYAVGTADSYEYVTKHPAKRQRALGYAVRVEKVVLSDGRFWRWAIYRRKV